MKARAQAASVRARRGNGKRRRSAALTLVATFVSAVVAMSFASPASSVPARTGGPRVAVYLTTPDLKSTLARQADVVFRAGTRSASNAVSVDPTVGYQRLTAGFGVAMTDTSAYELDTQLPTGLRDQVMQKLFSPVGGIGLSFLRVPIGGSDYVVGDPYTYDDMPAGQVDPTLAHFSLAHDQPHIIPMIRAALALNPAMSVMANPWTPPAWMKTDDRLVTTTGPLGTLLPQYYGAYANYLVKFLQGYQAAGIKVDFLGVQNEPLTPLLLVAGIPESYLSPADEGTLIHSDVAPALRQAGLGQKILAYDDGYVRDQSYIPVVMGTAAGDVGGFAYHCYLADASSMSVEHSRYPNEPALETECSSKLSNVEPAQMTIRSLRNWAQGIQLWNAALDQHQGPKVGNGCKGITPPFQGQDCIAPVTVNTTTHTYSLTSDYWALAQFSKFIKLGAQRIASTTPSTCPTTPAGGFNCGLEDVAFRNPDGSQVLVATTHDGNPHTLTVNENGQSFAYTIPDGATATFVWPAPPPQATGPSPRTGCPAPTGKLSGRRVGPIALGETRARARHGLRRSRERRAPYTDVFCLRPIGIRVGFPPPPAAKRLTPKARRATTGRVVLILTANRHYALHGVHPGTPLASAKRRLGLEKVIRAGRNAWYLAPATHAVGVLKVRRGRVVEVGIADHRFTRPRRLAMRFLTSF
jgi:glucosylceramidase